MNKELINEMHDYGYLWDGMTPLPEEEVITRIKEEQYCGLFLLYEDNTEGEISGTIAEQLNLVATHAKKGGFFGTPNGTNPPES